MRERETLSAKKRGKKIVGVSRSLERVSLQTAPSEDLCILGEQIPREMKYPPGVLPQDFTRADGERNVERPVSPSSGENNRSGQVPGVECRRVTVPSNSPKGGSRTVLNDNRISTERRTDCRRLSRPLFDSSARQVLAAKLRQSHRNSA